MATKKDDNKVIKTEGKKVVIDPQVAVHEATDPHTSIVKALNAKDIVATIWDNDVDPDHSYVKLDAPLQNRLVSVHNDELKKKNAVDFLASLVEVEEVASDDDE